MRAGERMGIDYHVASILGTWGFTSPTYMPSPTDITVGNDAMHSICQADGRVKMLVAVNPNFQEHAINEIERCIAQGAIGMKLMASRRSDDPLLDPICEVAATHGIPILHHIWQHRTREWPNQDISDGQDLASLAKRHPQVTFILAHIGGGGDYRHTFAAIEETDNIVADLSGSGIDRGMLEGALEALGPSRLLWGSDLTMETGLAKLRALARMETLDDKDFDDITCRNALRVFPTGSFPQKNLSETARVT